MQDFEKLGQFYLGRETDLARRGDPGDLLLYDSKDLTTHAVCVGMTGSGKTGLCLALLEEAAIDGVPAIAIDPKGDLGNLLLAFPELRPEDFRPWIDESEATRKGITPDELAASTAKTWREGLAKWDQDGARIALFRDAAQAAIYTPGSNAGLPLTVLRSFAAPPAAILEDSDAFRERVAGASAGLLGLLGVDGDPLRSREHILLAQILDHSWRDGRGLDLPGVIRAIQEPPFAQVGFVDLETFYPAKERFELTMRLNNLLASPSFAGWMQGDPLDIGRLLHTADGRPRLSVISIAHLSDAERMFFVTILLNEVLAWVRTQPGTSSLRAILYMDEIFGYFPPTANPPSKMPMLTLLKQARAHGLGIVLATQNPVDLDYKGLSNTGTWLLGRLQTERDKARVLEGLEGASTAAGAKFDRAKIEATLSGLGSRVFLMNNVHENQPVVFESRWCLSYLRGPLTRGQIQTLMAPRKQALAGVAQPAGQTGQSTVNASRQGSGARPLVPAEIKQWFVQQRPAKGESPESTYAPALYAVAKLHFVDSKSGTNHWKNNLAYLAPMADDVPDNPWEGVSPIASDDVDLREEPDNGVSFATLPAAMSRPKNYAPWQKDLAAQLYRAESLQLWLAPGLKEYSKPDESAGEFRVRLAHAAREDRDATVQKIRQKYAPKIATLENQIRRQEDKIEREKSQAQNQYVSMAASIGSAVLRAVMGRKWTSGTNVTSVSTAARSASRASTQRQDVARAEAELEVLTNKRADLESQVQAEIEHIEALGGEIALEEYLIRPRKSDISVDTVALVWLR